MGTRDRAATVLLVEFDEDERDRIATWLMEAGLDVLTCPGPIAPDYTCVGTRGGRCPLPRAADAVVLDLSLAGDSAMKGSPGWHVFVYYYELGLPVVLLTDPDDAVRPTPEDRVRLVRRPAERTGLLGELSTLIGARFRRSDDLAG